MASLCSTAASQPANCTPFNASANGRCGLFKPFKRSSRIGWLSRR